MKKNRFTGWSDGEIFEYIQIEKSNHATTCAFWVGWIVAILFAWENPNDAGFFVLVLVAVASGGLCLWSVGKGKKRLLELEQRQRKGD